MISRNSGSSTCSAAISTGNQCVARWFFSGQLLLCLSASNGKTSTRQVTLKRREECHRLVAGIARALTALRRSSTTDVADAVSPFVPDLDRESLATIIDGYRTNGLWAATPDLPPAALLRLKAALVSGGLIASDPSFDRLVDRDLSRNT